MSYPKTIRITAVRECTFNSEAEFLDWARRVVVPNEAYIEGDTEEVQTMLHEDYPHQCFEVPINTPEKLIKLMEFDLKDGCTSPVDYFRTGGATYTVEVV